MDQKKEEQLLFSDKFYKCCVCGQYHPSNSECPNIKSYRPKPRKIFPKDDDILSSELID